MRGIPRPAILFILICFSFLCASSFIEAQEEDILTAKTFISHDGVHPGKSFKVAFRLSITPGWHINGTKLDDEFLIPSELTVDENDDVQVLKYYYPEPKSEKFEYSDTELQIYDGEVIFGALFKVSDSISPKGHILKAQLLYQACDDRSCLPPNTLYLEIPFNVVPPSQKVNQINRQIFSKIDFENVIK